MYCGTMVKRVSDDTQERDGARILALVRRRVSWAGRPAGTMGTCCVLALFNRREPPFAPRLAALSRFSSRARRRAKCPRHCLWIDVSAIMKRSALFFRSRCRAHACSTTLALLLSMSNFIRSKACADPEA